MRVLGSREFRELLIADLAVALGVAGAPDVAAALQRFWSRREAGDVNIAEEIIRIAALPADALDEVSGEAERLVAQAGGDARVALTRRGGLDRSIHLALGERASPLSTALTEGGAGTRTPLHTVDARRYTDFVLAGEGGMGVVYMALDTEMNRSVAMKVVRPGAGRLGSDPTPESPIHVTPPAGDTPASQAFAELKARFLQEAWVTGGLSHPGVLPVYEMGQTPKGIPYYTMKFVRGQTTLEDALDDLRRGPVENRLRLLEPFLKVCDTLSYAHAKGVIHRDLKPANIALGEFGEVVVIDWGLAKLEGREDLAASRWQDRVRELRDATDLRTVGGAGTAGYMSPEAALGRLDQVDAKSDVYSLGALLYEILTGRLPYEFTTYAEYIECVTRHDPQEAREIDPAVPERLADLAARCGARERRGRPADVDEVSRTVRLWQAATAIEREVEGLLRDARAALDAAESASGDARLRHVERAAGAISQASSRQPDLGAVAALRAETDQLRETAVLERARASGRRLLIRMAVGVLAGAAGVAILVAGLLDRKRLQLQDERDATATAYEKEREASNLARVEAARAKEARDRAAAQAARAQTALDEVWRLSDGRRVQKLLEEADDLWLVHPERVRALADWLERSELLVSRHGEHVSRLVRLRERAEDHAPEERVARFQRLREIRAAIASLQNRLTARSGEHGEGESERSDATIELGNLRSDLEHVEWAIAADSRHWSFSDPNDSWMNDVLRDLLRDLKKLEITRSRMLPRHALAAGLYKRSIVACSQLWEETIQEVSASPLYGGLKLHPQLGLIPLGADPDSSLFEFSLHGSGSPPSRDADTGHLVYSEDAAVVMVLIPRGVHWVGAQAEDPDGPNYDANAPARGADYGPRKGEYPAFFIAKHECTQAQWQALSAGQEPSRYRSGVSHDAIDVTPRHPVESLTWRAANFWLSKAGLRLPSSSEWEIACRAGIQTPWFTGAEAVSLQGYANIADAALKASVSPNDRRHAEYTTEVNDGYAIHAPVGEFQPNAYGLYDMHGNVAEWCNSPGVTAGGSCSDPAPCARASHFHEGVQAALSIMVGVRPARHVLTAPPPGAESAEESDD